MNVKFPGGIRTASVLLVSLVMVACSLPATGGGSIGSDGSGSGSCTNLLYPVVGGAHWSYTSTGSIIGDYDFSSNITSVRADGFTLATEYSTGVTTSQKWSCREGNLSSLTAGSGPAATLSSVGGTTAQTVTTEISGVTLPASISAGDSWTQTFTLGGETSLPDGTVGTAEGAYTSTFTAIGMEDITVPAGTFRALRIDMQVLYDLTVTVYEIEVPSTIGLTGSLWYAPDVGLIRVESINDIMGTETIELVSYAVP